jgi:hypothetical protein
VSGIASDFQQRFGAGTEQEIIDDLFGRARDSEECVRVLKQTCPISGFNRDLTFNFFCVLIAATRLNLSRIDPIGLQFRGFYQGLQNDTILFRLFLQTAQLIRCCLRRINIELKPDSFESNRYIFCNAERTSKIQISFDGHLNAFRRYSHSRGHHLASKLSTGRQRAEQHVAGTSRGTRASYTGVSFGAMNAPPDRNGAGYRRLGLSAPGFQRDPRGRRIISVLVFQWFLNRLKIHDDLRDWAHEDGIVASLRAC